MGCCREGGDGVVASGGDDDDGDGWVTVESRVRESDGGDLIDREMGRIFGVGRKSSPEYFSGGCGVVVAGGGWWPAVGREREEEDEVVSPWSSIRSSASDMMLDYVTDAKSLVGVFDMYGEKVEVKALHWKKWKVPNVE
ncbi:hypothetical protein Tco_1056944 [Tanacetum coccineum]|uniref:Uncharacterized protein n=1 Tax=Tanacetum coccineum TaxID=301880 RepID=A0ABQ5H5R8_9ASTR